MRYVRIGGTRSLGNPLMGRRSQLTNALRRQPIVSVLVVMLLSGFASIATAQDVVDDMDITKVVPDAPSMYDEFDRALGRLSDYARDRFDSSSRRLDGGSAYRGGGGRAAADAIKNANRKRLSNRVQSLGSDDYGDNDDAGGGRLQWRMRTPGRGDEQQRMSNADTEMGKLLNVLMPNLAKANKQNANDKGQMRNTANEDINGDDDKVNKHQQHQPHDTRQDRRLVAVAGDHRPMRHRQNFAGKQEPNWIKANQKRFQHYARQHRHRPQHHLENGDPSSSSLVRNACELCSSSSSFASGGAFRCCIDDNENVVRHNGGPNYSPNTATGGINKTKRQTATSNGHAPAAPSINAMNLYQTRELSHSNPSLSDASYPEIVAKTSALLAPLIRKQSGSELSGSGNPYADFLNYYDHHQQRQQVHPHNMSPRAGGHSSRAAGDPVPPNIVVQSTSNDSVSSSPPATDNGGNQLSTPVTTVAANATTAGETSAPKPGSESGDASAGAEEPPSECAKYIDASNTSRVLQRVLDELERIRSLKDGQSVPEGAPCSILGSWNSEIIGLRFDINKTTDINKTVDTNASTDASAPAGSHELVVRLFNHNPPKRNTLMDTNWSTWGYALNHIGGPFSVTASVSKEHLLATFTGICKTCGGVDTIFGTWSIVHPAKDCGDLQTALETKRDIFRREMMFVKKQHRLEQLLHPNNNATTNETSAAEAPTGNTTTQAPPTVPTPGPNNQKKIHSVQNVADDYDERVNYDYY